MDLPDNNVHTSLTIKKEVCSSRIGPGWPAADPFIQIYVKIVYDVIIISIYSKNVIDYVVNIICICMYKIIFNPAPSNMQERESQYQGWLPPSAGSCLRFLFLPRVAFARDDQSGQSCMCSCRSRRASSQYLACSSRPNACH